MKKTVKILAALMAVALICAAFASCGGGDNTSSEKTSSDTSSAVDTAKTDWSKVDLEISDYAAMEDFRNKASEGAYDGKVVKFTGISEKLGSNCSIMEKNDEGTGIGMTYKLTDAKDSDYPADGAEVTLTGVVAVDSEYGSRYIEAPVDNIEVAE